MRDLMMLGAMIVFVPFAFSSRISAYLLWGWTGLLLPVYYLYGFMASVRFNMLFAAIALAAIFFDKNRSSNRYKLSLSFFLIAGFSCHMAASVVLGYSHNPLNETIGVHFMKLIVFCLVMPLFVWSRMHIHAVFVMLALGLGFHATVEGLKVIASGGGHRVYGIAMSMLSDNNHFGVAMVMTIPIFYYLFQTSANKIVRRGWVVGLFLTVVCILGTNSRGALIAMSVVGGWFFFTSQKKMSALMVIFMAFLAVYLFAPESWFERMHTISQAGEDLSFLGRVAAWKTSMAIALENPIFGGGLHAVQVQYVWEKFKSTSDFLGFIDASDSFLVAKAAHSVYFEIIGDMGFGGLLWFLSIFLNAIRNCFLIKRLAFKKIGCEWCVNAANAIVLSLVAYLVGGAGVSLAYFELAYMLVMLTEVIKNIAQANASDSAAQEI